MAHAAMVETYLHHLLDDRFGEDLEVRDGRYVTPLACAPRLRVVPGRGHALRIEVTAPVALGVAADPKLLAALNEINLGLPYGRVYLVDDVVAVEHTVAGEDLTGDDVDNTLRFVSWVVDEYGLALVDDFGGRTRGSTQMTLAAARPADEDDDEHEGRSSDGPVGAGRLVGASAGGYL